jgi:hypothetical protein
MTYTIRLLDPRAQKLLEALAHLKLIAFLSPQNQPLPPSEMATLSKEEELKGIASAVRQVNADIRGETQLPNIYDFLDALEQD